MREVRVGTLTEPAGFHAIRTHALTKRYGRKLALAGVNLTVELGTLYLLAGDNGAGKTTLLRSLLDLIAADGGEAFVLNLPSAKAGPQIRANAGWVPDGPPPVWNTLRVRELFEHQRRFYPKWDDSTETALCVQLQIDPTQRFGSLSKGQKVLAMLVLALAHRPPLLIWDEPTASLDPLRRELAVQLLLDQVAQGATVLLATHQISDFEGVADHLGVLDSGRLAAQISAGDLRRTYRRYEVEAPQAWQPGGGLSKRVLSVPATGGGLILQGEEDDIVALLKAQGATVRSVVPLTLAQACVAIMAARGNV